MEITIRCADVNDILTKQGTIRKHIQSQIESVLRSTGISLSEGTFTLDYFPNVVMKIKQKEADDAEHSIRTTR